MYEKYNGKYLKSYIIYKTIEEYIGIFKIIIDQF